MKNTIKLFIAVLLAYFAFAPSAFSDEKTDNSPTTTTKLEKKILQNGPRSGSIPYLDCIYNVGYLSLVLPDEFNFAEVTISANETSVVWTDIVTPDFSDCDIPVLSGQYEVTCTLDNGAIYQGIVVF